MQLLKRIFGLQDPFEPSERVAREGHESDPTVLDWWHETVPSRSQLCQYGVGLFPFYQWLGHYNLQWFFGDLIAGVTVGAVVIPESMGFAKLAGLPAHYGLYTSFMGGIIYWIFATSKDITIGVSAQISPPKPVLTDRLASCNIIHCHWYNYQGCTKCLSQSSWP